MKRDPGRCFENMLIRKRRRSAASLPISVVMHVVLVGLFVVVPILTSQELPEFSGGADYILVTPSIPPPPPPPRGPGNTVKSPPRTQATSQPITSDSGFPLAISKIEEIEPRDVDIEFDPNGIPDGINDGKDKRPYSPLVGGIMKRGDEPEKIYPVITTGIRPPRRTHYVAPEYPLPAKNAGIQGIVVVKCVINTTGSVVDVRIVKNIPFLGDAAMNAVRQWRYMPTLLNGVPIAISMDVNVTFTLQR